MQRPAQLAAHDLAFGLPGLRHRQLGGDRRVGVQLRIERGDAIEYRARDLDWRELAAGQPRGDFRDACLAGIGGARVHG